MFLAPLTFATVWYLERRMLYVVRFLDLHSVSRVSALDMKKACTYDLLSYSVDSFRELSSSGFAVGYGL